MPRGKTRVRFTPEARQDLKHGAVWYEDHRRDLGVDFATAIRAAVNLVAQEPRRWPIKHGTLRYVLRRFPYTIVYRINENDVLILAVAHHRVDPSDWKAAEEGNVDRALDDSGAPSSDLLP